MKYLNCIFENNYCILKKIFYFFLEKETLNLSIFMSNISIILIRIYTILKSTLIKFVKY